MKKTKGNARTVSKRPDGTWANKRDGAKKAGSLHKTQQAAEKAARQMLKKSGGGELKTKNEKGKIRSKDTIKPGNDPRKIKDREH
jgi:Uncharacterized protein conserved in bacteria (DUF2188)